MKGKAMLSDWESLTVDFKSEQPPPRNHTMGRRVLVNVATPGLSRGGPGGRKPSSRQSTGQTPLAAQCLIIRNPPAPRSICSFVVRFQTSHSSWTFLAISHRVNRMPAPRYVYRQRISAEPSPRRRLQPYLIYPVSSWRIQLKMNLSKHTQEISTVHFSGNCSIGGPCDQRLSWPHGFPVCEPLQRC